MRVCIIEDDVHRCAIPKLDVDAPEIMKHIKQMSPLNCKTDQIDLIVTEDGYAKFRPELIERHQDAQCALVYVLRTNDFVIRLSDERVELNFLRQEVKLEHDYFEANCKIPSTGQSATRIYASVHRDERLVDKLKSKSTNNKNEFDLNVLFYGFDSLSRVHFQRKLPKTYKLLTSRLNVTVLQVTMRLY